MRRASGFALGLLTALLIAAGAYVATRPRPPRDPDSAAVITQLREVARLETLDLTMYKKLTFTPDPPPAAEGTWQGLLNWASFTLRNPHGRAILFAVVHLGIDLQKRDAEHGRVEGDHAWLVLPPVTAQVELLPGETEIIDSNLDSADTARLLDAAKVAFGREALADPRLRERAKQANLRALRAVLATLGFRTVEVVDALPAPHRS
jgi:hypothetical protein